MGLDEMWFRRSLAGSSDQANVTIVHARVIFDVPRVPERTRFSALTIHSQSIKAALHCVSCLKSPSVTLHVVEFTFLCGFDSFRTHHPFDDLAASTDSPSMSISCQRRLHRKQVLGSPVHFRPEPVTSTVQNEIIRQPSICPGILELPGHGSDSSSARAAMSARIEDERHTLDWVVEL